MDKRILIARPHGFCAGVRHAVEMAEGALARLPPPVYALKDLVHNRTVVDSLAARGLRTVQRLDPVPPGACVLFSAHGVSPSVRRQADALSLKVLDATCPFVQRVHAAVKRYAREGCHILVVGHRTHDEIVGVSGEAPGCITVLETAAEARAVSVPDPARVAVVTQTTLGVMETAEILGQLRARFPAIRSAPESDICFATHNRQQAARAVAAEADRLLVLGSPQSSNSLRLVEVSRAAGCPADLVSTLADLDRLGGWTDVRVLGITAGASTPDAFVAEVVAWLRGVGFHRIDERTVVEEALNFTLPAGLRNAASR